MKNNSFENYNQYLKYAENLEKLLLLNQVPKIDSLKFILKVANFYELIKRNNLKISHLGETDCHIPGYTFNQILEFVTFFENIQLKDIISSGFDFLGLFYEQFSRYGVKTRENGISLTPCHITDLVVFLLDIRPGDVVTDLCSGTGRFAVSYTRGNVEFNSFEINAEPLAVQRTNLRFLRHIIHSDLDEPDILEEDNKYNNRTYLLKQDSLQFDLSKLKQANKAFINPPFSSNIQKYSMFDFADKIIDHIRPWGLICLLLPESVLHCKNVRKGESGLDWRKKLLDNNTLLASILIHQESFFPTEISTCLMIIRKGLAHEDNQNIYFADLKRDGFIKNKARRMQGINTDNDILHQSQEIKDFVSGKISKVEYIKGLKNTVSIKEVKENYDFNPRVYINGPDLDESGNIKEEDIEKQMEEMLKSNIFYRL